VPRVGLLLATVALVTACGVSSRDHWAEARELYRVHRNDNDIAWNAWNAIEPGSPEGAEARRRISDADRLYREGIAGVESGATDANVTLAQAVALAPIDPDLYLTLARALRARAAREPDNLQVQISAEEFYARFLALRPHSPEAEAARAELAAFGPESGFDTDPLSSSPVAAAPEGEQPLELSIASALAGSAFVLALIAIGLLLRRREQKGLTLAELASARPELHPAIAYLIGSLRHELLKHRIGAVASGVAELASGRASSPAQAFVQKRLYGGEPLEEAWDGHLRAFERALGPDLDLRRRDVAFVRAGAAIATLARLQARVARGDEQALGELRAAHRELRAFDGALQKALHRLSRTRVDEGLLREVVGAVRAEANAGRVALDGIALEAPSPGPLVEVFRADLWLVLKNVVRNAILAVERHEPPRRVRLEVGSELEPTGEEQVVIRVLDTSPARPDLSALEEAGIDRGLGLVSAALRRYHGALSVEDAEAPYQKAVVVRFFRAFDEDP
jgi:hypothetical protein